MVKKALLGEICKIKEIKEIKEYSKERTEEYRYPLKGGGKGLKGYVNYTNCKKNTITITTGGTCGYVDFIDEDFAITKGCLALENVSKEVDTFYLYLFLKVIEPKIKSLARGVCIEHLKKSEVEKIVISYPDLEEQRRIIEVLSNFNKVIVTAEKEAERLKYLYRQMRRTLLII